MGAKPRHKGRSSTTAKQDELARFARAFKSEAELQSRLATLLREMGRERVRILHGPSEHGKDIVFHGPSGLDGQSLYACVLKNTPITGEAGSDSSARTVLHQAQEAFQYPYTNPDTGQQEQVRGVYVISPYECTPIAQESISAQLRGFGAVEFRCGASLLDLFAKHLRVFLLESNVLVSYLSALRTGLQSDTALLRIILQKAILADIPMDFEAMYVAQHFRQTIRRVKVGDEVRESIPLPRQKVRYDDVRRLEDRLKQLHGLVEYFDQAGNLQVDDLDGGLRPQSVFSALARDVRTEWTRAYQAHVAQVQKEYEAALRKRGGGHGRPQPPPAVSQRAVTLTLNVSEETQLLHSRAEDLRRSALAFLEEKCARIRELTLDKYQHDWDWLTSKELKFYCALLDLCEIIPGAIHVEDLVLKELTFDAQFLDSSVKIVLISGPAGFGKTSFCKWQALTSAEALLSEKADVLPIFVPLYKFAYEVPQTVQAAFFDSPELQLLLADPNRATKIRLFLDGLDEVPHQGRQAQIVDLALAAMGQVSDLQIVITARDHVVGPWLEGVVRLRVQPLNDFQQRTLVMNWLGSSEATNAFFAQISKLSPLRPLLGVPLLASLIAAVYKKQQYLPANRTALYSLFIELLCGGWDTAKGIKRQDRFGVHDKRLVLAHLAGKCHISRSRDASLLDFRVAVKQSLSKLVEHSDDLLTEILQDGLLVNTGAGVRFSHLSFQEYLAAEFLVMGDPSRDRVKLALKQFYSGDDWWKEVLTFYVTSTSNPGDTEDWLIKRAKECRASIDSSAVLTGQFDERLGYLRSALREAFPSYLSKYPEDGIVTELSRRRSGEGTVLFAQRCTLTGLKVDN
jgi:hypothetical protein